MRRILIWAAILSWVIGGGFSDVGAVEKSLIRVKLLIQADKEVQTSVENQLRKELRALGDISLVNEKPDFEIRVIVMGSAAKEKENSGVAFSTVFLSPYVRSGIPDFYINRCKGDKEGLKVSEEIAETQIYQEKIIFCRLGRQRYRRNLQRHCPEFQNKYFRDPRLSPQSR